MSKDVKCGRQSDPPHTYAGVRAGGGGAGGACVGAVLVWKRRGTMYDERVL